MSEVRTDYGAGLSERLARIAPALAVLARYRSQDLPHDVVAGLSVAAVALPVGVAYAELAGFNPVIGLYSSILPLAAYALFGSSRQLIVGPDAATCALVAAAIAPLAAGDPGQYLALSMALAFLAGLLSIGASFLKLGALADFLSRPILVGFMNGIAHNRPMIAHSISMDPTVTGDPSLLDPVVLHCAGGDPPLRIVPASSQTYFVSARSIEACNRLVHEALRHPQTQLVSRSGGLLSNLSVLENMMLPAVYHGRVAKRELADQIYQTFNACGLDRQQADALCERSAGEVEGFDRLLVALLRALLMRPAVLVLERVFEGLTAEDMKRVAQFPRHYRKVVAAGAVVFIDRAGIACPDVDADVRAAAE